MDTKTGDSQKLNRDASELTRQLTRFLEKNEAILKGIEEGVVIFDLDDRAVASNPAAARLLERPVHEIACCDIGTLLGKEKEAVRDRNDGVLELDSDSETLLINLVPVCDPAGKTLCTVAVLHDLTQEVEGDPARDGFVNLASHELRTPLSAVLGYIDMLREDVYGPLTTQQRSAVERAAANTEQLVSLISGLLDQSQMQTGGLALHHAPFATIKLVDNVQTVMARAARYKGLKLSTCIADDVPSVLYGDFQRLCLVLANLVENAIKCTTSGMVRVEIFRPSADLWALKVSDTGGGISEEARERVVAPFRQASDVMGHECQGVGLELSIVKQLVALMNGEIELESETGKGSTFTVVLPLLPSAIDGFPPR
ncbi:MAG: HAMP domain-containing histidine kinase [Anaerolineae bacterium]|nr:HAMP domain-containing histidine kinase [Anaerolineae bacterium]